MHVTVDLDRTTPSLPMSVTVDQLNSALALLGLPTEGVTEVHVRQSDTHSGFELHAKGLVKRPDGGVEVSGQSLAHWSVTAAITREVRKPAERTDAEPPRTCSRGADLHG